MFFFFACSKPANYEQLENIKLLKPDKTRGLTLMKALDVRKSATSWSARDLELQDLSDLLWASNGINRPRSGKRTAASAQNAQDIDIYVFMKERVYLYDASKHNLSYVVIGDHRNQFEKTDAPVVLLLVSDISRFRDGYDDYYLSWANIDCGIVSQNIALFCAATGLRTRPKAIFKREEEQLRELLQLKDSQYILLHHPVGYSKYPINIRR